MRHDPASAAIVIMLRSLKMHGMSQAVIDLIEQGVVSGFEDVAAMGETVEQGGGHLGVTEHRGPFAEAEVGCDHDACAFVEFAQQVEEQRPA